MSSKFRINAKSVFLTYPQCDLTNQFLMNHLASLKYECDYIITCEEKHADGSPHMHAVLKFKKKVDIRNEAFFDISGFHPNIQTTKNINASINYCKKDKCFLEEGSLQEHVNALAAKGQIPEYTDVYKFLDSLLIGYE